MTGLMRLQRLVLESGSLHAVAVFTGELFEADGSRVGVGSRRAIVPAEVVRSGNGVSVSIGTFEVDLLGLAVNVEAFSMELEPAAPQTGGGSGGRLQSVPS